MATRSWDDGASDGIFITAANWSADTAPVSTDTAIIATSSRSIGAADNSAVALAALRILPGYGGTASGLTIGGTAALKIGATELEINNARMSICYLEGAYPTCNIRALGGCQLIFGPTSDLGEVRLPNSGNVIVETGSKLLTLHASAGCSVLIKGDTSTPDDLSLYIPRGCKVECQRRIKSAWIEGTLDVTGAAEGVAGSGTSEWVVAGSGTLNIQSTGGVAGIRVLDGGRVDGSKQVGGSTKPTIGSLIYNPGTSRVNVPTSLFTITATYPLGDGFQAGVAP